MAELFGVEPELLLSNLLVFQIPLQPAEIRFSLSLTGDGKIDATERFLWDELMCTSKEEHEALFGDAGDFDEDDDDEDDIDFEDCDMDDDF